MTIAAITEDEIATLNLKLRRKELFIGTQKLRGTR